MRGLREGVGSILSILVVLMVLVSLDAGWKMRALDFSRDPVEGGRVASARVERVGRTLWQVAREHTSDNPWMVIFAVAGVVLVVFMLRV